MTHAKRATRRSRESETTSESREMKNYLQFPLMSLFTRRVQCALDLLVLVSSFVMAYLLRFDFAIPEGAIYLGLVQLPYVVLIQLTLLILTDVYAFIWRYVGMSEVKAFIKAAFWSALPQLIVRIWLPETYHTWRVPLSVIVMDTILAFGGILGLRVLGRALYERYEKRQRAPHTGNDQQKKPVLMIGAGHAGMLAVREIQRCGNMELEIKGFVDDDSRKQRSVIQGVRVLGLTSDLPWLVRELGIDHVVISIAQASRQDFRRILDICEQIPVKVRIIPGISEILQGKVKITRIRDVQVEDLLGREPVQLDEEGVRRFLAGKRIMVTGAGGSIGSGLARQVAQFEPSSLLLVERSEHALFDIERELRAAWPELPIIPLLADVGDEARMRSIFAAHHPHVILHAAAHKHVPMMELSPAEAVKNNVLTTQLLGEMAGEFGAEVFILISTDKAVRPTSVMGATKRVAELVVQHLDRRFAMRCVAVRFGNVMGSAGSVIPIFREQIQKGGPVTVTHPDMMRYFMTISEAAQLVLQAGTMGEGGEIFILDMGEPVSILDLAKQTITLSGLKPFEDIDIVFTGLRPGEKLFEELETNDERVAKTRHPKIFIGKIAPYPEEKVNQALLGLATLSKGGHDQEVCRFLDELLPEAQLEIVRETHASLNEYELLPVAASGSGR